VSVRCGSRPSFHVCRWPRADTAWAAVRPKWACPGGAGAGVSVLPHARRGKGQLVAASILLYQPSGERQGDGGGERRAREIAGRIRLHTHILFGKACTEKRTHHGHAKVPLVWVIPRHIVLNLSVPAPSLEGPSAGHLPHHGQEPHTQRRATAKESQLHLVGTDGEHLVTVVLGEKGGTSTKATGSRATASKAPTPHTLTPPLPCASTNS